MQSGGIKPVCKMGINDNENKVLFLEKKKDFVTLCIKKKCEILIILEKYIY